MRILASICVLTFLTFAQAIDPAVTILPKPNSAIGTPDPVKVTEPIKPVAKLAGPSECEVGQQIKFSSEGSVGADIQFSVSPPTISFEPVKLLDGKDTPGVIFTPSRPGTYYIYMILNSDNKTGFTVSIVSVKGQSAPVVPVVPIKPDQPYFDLKGSIKADRNNDAMSDQYLGSLLTLMDEWPGLADSALTFGDFTSSFRVAAQKVLPAGQLTETRRAIAAYMSSRFPKEPSQSTNKELIAAVRAEIVATIKVSK